MNVMSILACKLARVPVVCSERSNPNKDKIGVVFDFMRRRLYPHADMNIFQTGGANGCFKGIASDKAKIIPDALSEIPPVNLDAKDKTIIAMGRFVFHKRFDRLISAVAKMQERLRQEGWRVELYGGGKLYNDLKQQIDDALLSDLIQIRNKTKAPFSVLSLASTFVLSSEYEGFPNVLWEAMACGCVPVSVDCDFGPREIIEREKNGLLVEQSSDGVAQGLLWLMDNPERLEQMRGEAVMIDGRLHLDKIVEKWESVIEKMK
jgi:glycosyltransferase involved in cell wall biosynthesis